MKTKHWHLPASDPMISEGLQVFTTRSSGVPVKRSLDKKDALSPGIEEQPCRSERPELDLETAISNFDKLQDAYELGGAEAVKEKFLEMCRKPKKAI